MGSLPRRHLLALIAATLCVPTRALAETPWRKQIDAFIASDASSPPAPGQILFTGSSSIRTWDSLEADMAPLGVLERGFGGAHIDQVTHYVPEIVWPYAPRAIVLYAGDNDIHHGKSPERVAADFQAFVARVRERLPTVPVTFLSIKPSLARVDDWPAMVDANTRVRAIVDADPLLHYIDVATPMLGADGKPRPELFIGDGLHLNATGFALWTSTIKPVLQRDLPKPTTP